MQPALGGARKVHDTMKECRFSIPGLRAFLEDKLGGPLRRFDMIRASRAENFRVETAVGENLLVKCVPPEAGELRDFRDCFMTHLKELSSAPFAMRVVYGPWDFGECVVVATAWSHGHHVSPSRLSSGQEASLIAGYEAFSAALQSASALFPPRDNIAVRAEAMGLLDCPGGGSLKSFLDRELPASSLRYDPARMRVIHGDFHEGNILFSEEGLDCILDYEDFRPGYPADDWVRYVVCASEHLKWFDAAGRRHLIELFRRLLPKASADEWRTAIGGLLVRKVVRRFTSRKSPRVWLALNLRFRLSFYRRLLAIVATEAR